MEELPGLCVRIAVLCSALGTIDFKDPSIDGQKITANANFRNTVNRKRAQKNLDRTRKGMEKRPRDVF